MGAQVAKAVEKIVLDKLVGEGAEKRTYDEFAALYKEGGLDTHEITLDLPSPKKGNEMDGISLAGLQVPRRAGRHGRVRAARARGARRRRA